jgi:(1->4)-alpha-D-glucan 1-alpha-D-glucosylmutase
MSTLNRIYGEYTSEPTEFPPIAHDKKINVMEQALGSDVNRLTSLFVEICEANRNQRDFTRTEIRRAIREVASCFAIYRTYVVPEREEITDEDRMYIERATTCAKDNRSDIPPDLFDFMRDVLSMKVGGRKENEFVLRFQQFTSPVMAKGVEDTAFYCYNRLVSMNEVGADPGHDGTSIEEFHGYNAKIQATHPRTMTTLSTHDTKRADDVRARLAVLSEIPRHFRQALRRWTRLNSGLRTGNYPDRNTEYFYYQTLIGAWPITPERMQAYMEKATREAKQQTSWTANNKDFEDALRSFIDRSLTNAPFVADLEQFVARVREPGRVNSLAQTLMKYTSPGVPDLYQGSELWDLSLVDPDNRRPVDYEQRRSLLAELQSLPLPRILERSDEGLTKLWTITRSLRLRRDRPELFGSEAGYEPLRVEGKRRHHAIAYLRADRVVTVVPRLTLTLDGNWADTSIQIPEGVWSNHLTGEEVHGGLIRVDGLLRQFPVALLVKQEEKVG